MIIQHEMSSGGPHCNTAENSLPTVDLQFTLADSSYPGYVQVQESCPYPDYVIRYGYRHLSSYEI
jgi:hypothetical protein